jgi:hypothetical protein
LGLFFGVFEGPVPLLGTDAGENDLALIGGEIGQCVLDQPNGCAPAMKKPVANHEVVETAVLRISVTAMTLSDGISAASFLDIGARRGVVVVLTMGVPFVFSVGARRP